MKVSTLIVAGSLAANAALLAFYVSRSGSDAAAAGTAGINSGADAGAPGSGPAGGARKKGAAGGQSAADVAGQAWAQLNTGDLRALAARLRAAGFPASVVRSVIAAQVNESFKARRAALVPAAEERPFWQTNPGGIYGGMFANDQKYYAALRELGREQSQIMKEILGADATSGEMDTYNQRRYGDLSSDRIEQLQRLDQDYNELRNEANRASLGIMLPEDREKLALLEKERRADLALLLSPQEMEDYLMRTSTTTTRLRTALTTFNASESEFRSIYQAQLAFDEKYSMGGAMTPDVMRDRQAAQTQVNDQIKAALGDQRYAEYVRASDREFQQLNRMAQLSSLPEKTATEVYDYRNTVLKNSNQIFDDASLSAEQKRTALQNLGQNARTQITTMLGADVGDRYLQVANRWIAGLERGAAVTFNENGALNIRNVPPPRPAPNPGAGGNLPRPQ